MEGSFFTPAPLTFWPRPLHRTNTQEDGTVYNGEPMKPSASAASNQTSITQSQLHHQSIPIHHTQGFLYPLTFAPAEGSSTVTTQGGRVKGLRKVISSRGTDLLRLEQSLKQRLLQSWETTVPHDVTVLQQIYFNADHRGARSKNQHFIYTLRNSVSKLRRFIIESTRTGRKKNISIHWNITIFPVTILYGYSLYQVFVHVSLIWLAPNLLLSIYIHVGQSRKWTGSQTNSCPLQKKNVKHKKRNDVFTKHNNKSRLTGQNSCWFKHIHSAVRH